MCVYVLNACSSKNLCGIAQFGRWVCYNMFCRENESVLSCIVAWLGWPGTLQHGIRASFFDTEPGWAEQVELKRNVTED
jgi:hypothetical protein